MQHQLHDHRAVLHEKFLEGVDLIVALFNRVGIGQLAHLDHQHIFIVRAVKNMYHTLLRRVLVDAPQKVVFAF